jgi:pyruvate/2-oxoglutarate dehydrogenase complex dihydrolipoamide acyltransferase (E2) component
MLGYENVFAPFPRILCMLTPFIAFTQVPFLITVGSTIKRPIVVHNEIQIRDSIKLTLTLDNRYTTPAGAASMYKKLNDYLHDPDKCLALEHNQQTLIEAN